MKKKILVMIPIIILAIIPVCLGVYIGLRQYYIDTFWPNTWINGIYCTGKTISEINDYLIQNTAFQDIIMEDIHGHKVTIRPEEIDLKVDYSKKLVLVQNNFTMNQANLGFDDLKSCEIEQGDYSWNHNKLMSILSSVSFIQEEKEKPYGCKVSYQPDKGFFLYNGNLQRLNTESLSQYLESCLEQGVNEINLSNSNCYEDLKDSKEDIQQREVWNRLESFINNHSLLYDMGAEKIKIDNRIISSFLWNEEKQSINIDENGELFLEEEKVSNWIDELAKRYDTVDTTREFLSTRGDFISVSYVTYGTKLDEKKEKEFLLDQMLGEKIEDENKIHIPAYIKEGYTRGLDDIGDTYIEVDMTMQHMYYYQKGELMLDTDIVTGNTGRKMGTPEGINYVYGKQKNRVLVGPNYATFVKYWVPVKGHVGIHDANWRSEFGGEIYKTNGSHGCINTPTEKMAELYDMVEIGTPVVMFY